MSRQKSLTTFKEELFQTDRTDYWWVEPLLTGFGFFCFVIYTTWAMLQGNYYWWSAGSEGFGGYLSPFYSPLLFHLPGDLSGHSWFGVWPDSIPSWIPKSPALFILIFPFQIDFSLFSQLY